MRNWILFSCLLFFFGCQNEIAFDSEKWKEKGVDWQLADTREKMAPNLISSDTLIGMKSDKIIDLLGKPDFIKEESLEFLIREKYSRNIDPDYIKYLIVEIDETGEAKNVYVQRL